MGSLGQLGASAWVSGVIKVLQGSEVPTGPSSGPAHACQCHAASVGTGLKIDFPKYGNTTYCLTSELSPTGRAACIVCEWQVKDPAKGHRTYPSHPRAGWWLSRQVWGSYYFRAMSRETQWSAEAREFFRVL